MSRAFFLVGPEDRRRLTLLTQTGTQRMAARARIVLLSEQGLSVEQIASELSIVPPTVYKWRRRFAERGIAGLYDLPRPGQPLKLTEQRKRAIVRLVTEAVPEDALDWSIRRLAKVAGVTEHQARSVLGRRPEPASTATPLGWPLQLAAVCLAPPLVGAALLVDPHAPAADPLNQALSQAHPRLARTRNDPRSLYRAFAASVPAPPTRPLPIARYLDALTRLSNALPPTRALELLVAPASAFAAALSPQLSPSARVVALPSVSVWLRTVEGLLLWLEDDASGAATAAADVNALRVCLAQHSVAALPQHGGEFFWQNPRLNTPAHSRQG